VLQDVRGHRRNSTTYTLTFDESHGEELEGLIVECRGASHQQLFEIARLGNFDLHNLMTEGIDALAALCQTFPDRIIDWNHQDEEGRPIPPTLEAFLDEDYTFSLPIVTAWVNTVRANPKNATTISSIQQRFAEEAAPADLSDLPMHISA